MIHQAFDNQLEFLYVFLCKTKEKSQCETTARIDHKPSGVSWLWNKHIGVTAWKVKFSFKDYIRKHAVFWSFTPEYCMFSDVILKGKLHFSCSVWTDVTTRNTVRFNYNVFLQLSQQNLLVLWSMSIQMLSNVNWALCSAWNTAKHCRVHSPTLNA